MSERRGFLDRFLAAIPYLVAGLALLSLLFWQASIRRTPTIFSDELEWTQISRAIASTGHAARRGDPIGVKSMYALVLAPFWWIHSTGTAYAAIKYVNTLLMALTAVPTYLLARMLVPRRAAIVTALAALCTTALYYAPFILPEVVAYPTFALGAWLSVRALAGGGRRWVLAAIVVDLAATQVRGELLVLPAAFALAAIVLWLCGPESARIRDWSWVDHAGAALLTLGVLIVLNRLLGDHSHQWKVVTESWKGRLWSLGMESTSAFALGIGLLPLVGGLAALWLPVRRADPVWRAFAAFSGAAIVTVWTYTAVKAAYNSTIFATRVEERNLIYLGPLVLVGTAVWLCSSRRWLPGTIAAWAITSLLVLSYGYQLDFPYFEAPGYGIAAMANRAWQWDQPTIQIALGIACIVLLLVVVMPAAMRGRTPVIVLACAAAVAWMLAAEVTSSRGSAIGSRTYAGNLPQPLDWLDRATGSAGATYIGQNITAGDALGVNLLEFWNRNVKHIWSLDGSAPGPGPTLTPDLVNRFGTLSHDPGLPYVVAPEGVDLIGPIVERNGGYRLFRIDDHPWRLHQASYGVSNDGWISGSSETHTATGTYAYFGPEVAPGTLHAVVARRGFCSQEAPPAHVVVRVGPVALNEQRAPVVAKATKIVRFVLPNCGSHDVSVRIAPPLAVQVTASPTVRPTDYGGSDNRDLGAQVGFSFSAR